jgi:hypothetical protein
MNLEVKKLLYMVLRLLEFAVEYIKTQQLK